MNEKVTVMDYSHGKMISVEVWSWPPQPGSPVFEAQAKLDAKQAMYLEWEIKSVAARGQRAETKKIYELAVTETVLAREGAPPEGDVTRTMALLVAYQLAEKWVSHTAGKLNRTKDAVSKARKKLMALKHVLHQQLEGIAITQLRGPLAFGPVSTTPTVRYQQEMGILYRNLAQSLGDCPDEHKPVVSA